MRGYAINTKVTYARVSNARVIINNGRVAIQGQAIKLFLKTTLCSAKSKVIGPLYLQ